MQRIGKLRIEFIDTLGVKRVFEGEPATYELDASMAGAMYEKQIETLKKELSELRGVAHDYAEIVKRKNSEIDDLSKRLAHALEWIEKRKTVEDECTHEWSVYRVFCADGKTRTRMGCSKCHTSYGLTD